jgi:hypothetical protein
MRIPPPCVEPNTGSVCVRVCKLWCHGTDEDARALIQQRRRGAHLLDLLVLGHLGVLELRDDALGDGAGGAAVLRGTRNLQIEYRGVAKN